MTDSRHPKKPAYLEDKPCLHTLQSLQDMEQQLAMMLHMADFGPAQKSLLHQQLGRMMQMAALAPAGMSFRAAAARAGGRLRPRKAYRLSQARHPRGLKREASPLRLAVLTGFIFAPAPQQAHAPAYTGMTPQPEPPAPCFN